MKQLEFSILVLERKIDNILIFKIKIYCKNLILLLIFIYLIS